MKIAITGLLLAFTMHAQTGLSRDSNGWTVFTPASDTRIAYVSQTDGVDSLATTYVPGDPAIGVDPFLPAGGIKPFKTIASALRAVRDTSPDWLLLKKGDTWYESGDVKIGRSDAFPFLFSAYGSGLERPLLKTGSKGGVDVCCKNNRNFAIVGISFFAHTRDRRSPEFVSDSGSTGFNIYSGEGYTTRGILIEDCMFRFYLNNVIQGPGTLSDIVVRRCVITDNYSSTSHSQGMYTSNVAVTLEENVFDHNGWYMRQIDKGNEQDSGQATMFNHNTYFAGAHDVVFRSNLFLRASSIGNKWTANDGPASTRNITIENNLYVEGEIGISMGGNTPGPLRFKNIHVADNVMLDIGRDQPTNRTLGWGLDIQEWDSGTVSRNLFLHNATDIINNVWAISVGGLAGTRNVSLLDNIVYGIKTNGTLVHIEDTLSGVRFSGNSIQSQNINARLLNVQSFTGISFSSNSYFSTRTETEWFNVAGTNTDLTGWITRSGETESKGMAITYPDPGRTVESYHATLGKPSTFAAFIAEARKQSKTLWRTEYTAAAINKWIRDGFGISSRIQPFQHNPHPAPFKLFLSTGFRVYSQNGRLLGTYKGVAHAEKSLPRGIYLIVANGRAVKFLHQ